MALKNTVQLIFVLEDIFFLNLNRLRIIKISITFPYGGCRIGLSGSRTIKNRSKLSIFHVSIKRKFIFWLIPDYTPRRREFFLIMSVQICSPYHPDCSKVTLLGGIERYNEKPPPYPSCSHFLHSPENRMLFFIKHYKFLGKTLFFNAFNAIEYNHKVLYS